MKNKIISSQDISKAVADACKKMNIDLDSLTFKSLSENIEKEKSSLGKSILNELVENAKYAKEKQIPLCQDTGMVIAFVEIGNKVQVEGDLYDAINQGVAMGYQDNFFRKSIVKDPIFGRENTNNNTPAVIHTSISEGEDLIIKVASKGFGSENMGALKMLTPFEGLEGLKKFVIDTIFNAGSNPCPPISVGIGVGGSMEKATILAKKALFRDIGERNSDENYAKLEKELLEEINKTGVGPQGLGGNTTALDVFIEYFPTHIAGLPVAVNLNCHAVRHEKIVF